MIGGILAIWPTLWSGLFTDDPEIADAAAAYLSRVGPAYAAFGLGLCLYFASQGLETLTIPVAGAFIRIAVVIAGFWGLAQSGALEPRSALWVIVVAMLAYGGSVGLGLALGPWRKVPRERAPGLG